MEELSAILGMGRSAIYQNIKSMKEKGLLSREGRKRDGKWVIK
ncbi:MAG: hypothetical protein K2H68_05735 [Bacteroidales bacterium]|nr:hypothetical protein [Bacteroidales bacterium]